MKNLASHVLSVSLRRVKGDWIERYGFAPEMVETYVEREKFQGTCYKAANWPYIGSTNGRGRQDKERKCAVSVKDIYVYPLGSEVVEKLRDEPLSEMEVEDGKQGGDWVSEEFGRVDLGDRRPKNRLMIIANDFYARPQANIPQACQTRAKTKAVYRFFEHPVTSMEELLKAHYESMLSQARKEGIVLAVPGYDTYEL